ncbi:Pentatricopeptide repeat-containing protein [Thalictrum thalictroides]|uniref:Pentatricopeptide repeat-containing protein n=1 Tax=Thalictrum thalictroides TaxID=46969 RepID=A0A7J6WLD6_THATH|nr:Pentatricopeptide repeat-containing protein [Thalictrum thalictroides]
MNGIRKKTFQCFSKLNHDVEFKLKIQSLCNFGRLQEAINTLFSKPNSLYPSLYPPILQLCIDLRADKEGRLIHDHLMRNGYLLDLNLNTKFVIFYSKIGDIENAHKVFDEMSEKSVVSWTAMISGFCQNGYLREGLDVFSVMHRSSVKPNQFTYGSVLRACTSLMCFDIGIQVQGTIVKSIFSENLFVQSALVDLHSKCGRMEDARYLFEQMAHRDVVCWNTLIGGYAAQGFADESFVMFCSLLNEGLVPDQFSIGNVLRACSCGRPLFRVNQIHGFVVRLGFESHGVVIGSLIDAYAKCGSVRSARLLYDLMQEKDLISCTTMITGYAREGSGSMDALDIFGELYRLNMGMDAIVLCSMLNICANIASLCLGSQIHALALKSQPEWDVALSNALIDMYAKSGEIGDAHRAFDEMEDKNVVSWTSLITGYAKHGCQEKTIALFEKMEDNGVKPNDVTFLSVLFACSHTGMTDKGREYFGSMINMYNISPRAEHYACMVDLFARAGQLEQASELLSKMNLKPNASLWGAILGASRTYGSLSVAEEAAKHLFDLDPDNSVNYIVMAGIYSEAGLWEEARKIRKAIVHRKMKKEPGCSLLQNNMKRRGTVQRDTRSIPFYSYKEIERATSCFSERHRIGTGAYGTVYAGKLHNDEWVAIKKIRHASRR